MDQWIAEAIKLGIAGLVIAGAGYAWVKQIWPMIQERLKKADEERADNTKRMDEQAKLFAEVIRARDVMMAEIQERNLNALETMAMKLDMPKTVKTRRK